MTDPSQNNDQQLRDVSLSLVIEQIVRLLAVACLLGASFFILGQDSAFCLYGYWGGDQIVDLRSLTGGISKDSEMIEIGGVISLFFCLPLFVAYRYGWYMLFFGIHGLVQALLLGMIEAPSILGLIYDSIYYCHNSELFFWVIGQFFFNLFSLVFIFYSYKNE